MRKEDMTAHIVKLSLMLANARLCASIADLREWKGNHTNPSSVTSVDANPPGISFESTIIQDGPSYTLHKLDHGWEMCQIIS